MLLLHGQPGSARDWDAVRRALGDRVRTIAPDRPGWDGCSEPRDLAGNAQSALEVLDRSGTERAVVAGHSLGAAIAAWLAVAHPERVAGLVLASPAANVASLEAIDRVLAAPLAGPLLGAAVLALTGLVLAPAPARALIAGRLRLDPGYLEDTGRALRTPGSWRAFAAEQRALVAQLPALEARLATIAAPAAILAGSGDRIVPLAAARRLAGQITHARLEVIDGADHLLPQRHGGRVARAILELADAATGGLAPPPAPAARTAPAAPTA